MGDGEGAGMEGGGGGGRLASFQGLCLGTDQSHFRVSNQGQINLISGYQIINRSVSFQGLKS